VSLLSILVATAAELLERIENVEMTAEHWDAD